MADPILRFYTTGGALTNVLTGITGAQRGAAGAPQTFDVYNDKTGAGGAGVATARNVKLYVWVQMTTTDPPRGSGVEIVDSQFWKAQLTGVVFNPGGLVGPDYTVETTPLTKFGGRTPFVFPGAMPRQFGRRLVLEFDPTGGGGEISFEDIRISLDWAGGIDGRDIYADEIDGRGIVVPGGKRYFVLGGHTKEGIRLLLHPALANSVIVSSGNYLLADRVVKEQPYPTDPGAGYFDDNAADGAMVAGESYRTLLFEAPTGGISLVKGLKSATVPTDPASPGSGYTRLGRVTKHQGAALIAADVETDVLHDFAHVTADGTANDVVVGRYMGILGGTAHLKEGTAPVSGLLGPSLRSIIKLGTLGTFYGDGAAPILGEIPVGVADTDAGSNVTFVQQRAMMKSRGSRLGIQDWIEEAWHGAASGAPTSDLWMFGRMEQRALLQAPPYSVTTMDGLMVWARCDGFTTAGTLRATGTKLLATGAETAGTTEDVLVYELGQWARFRNRWNGTNGASTTAAMTAVGGLVATFEFHALDPWTDYDRLFHVRRLTLTIVPMSVNAACRFRLWKIPRVGAVDTIFDLTLGPGAARGFAAAQIGRPQVFPLSQFGANNCDVDIAAVHDKPVIQGHLDEGVALQISGITDLEYVKSRLDFDRLLCS